MAVAATPEGPNWRNFLPNLVSTCHFLLTQSVPPRSNPYILAIEAGHPLSRELITFDPESLARIRNAISDAMPELRAALYNDNCDFASPVCRGASGELQKLLMQRGVHAESVGTISSNHNLLRITDPVTGAHIFVDATYLQFVHPDRREGAPEVFVGTELEGVELFKKLGILGNQAAATGYYFDVHPYMPGSMSPYPFQGDMSYNCPKNPYRGSEWRD